MKPQKYLKAIVIHLSNFKSYIVAEKNFSVGKIDEAGKWLSGYNQDANLCQCYEMQIEL